MRTLFPDHIEDRLKAEFFAGSLLSGAGYPLIRRTGPKGWYVPKPAAAPRGFGSLQIVRKYYLALPIGRSGARKRRWRDQLHGIRKS